MLSTRKKGKKSPGLPKGGWGVPGGGEKKDSEKGTNFLRGEQEVFEEEVLSVGKRINAAPRAKMGKKKEIATEKKR